MIDVVSKADFAQAQKEIADLRQRLEAANEAKVKEQIDVLNKSVASRDDEIKNLKTEVDNVKASKKEVEKIVESSKAEVEVLKTKLTEAETKISEHAKSVILTNRVAALVDKGVEKTEAERIVNADPAASEEIFAVILETQAKLVEAAKAAAMPKEKEKTEEKKKDEKKAAKADEEKLAEAKAEEEAPLATGASQTDEVDSVVASLADFLSQLTTDSKKK